MAVAFDAISGSIVQTNKSTTSAAVTSTITIGASATIVVIYIEASVEGGQNDSTITPTITLDGLTPTQVTGARVHSGGGTSGWCDLYYLLTTNAGGSLGTGTKTLSVKNDGTYTTTSGDSLAFACSYTGALAGAVFGTAKTATGSGASSQTLTDTLASGDLLVGCAVNGTAAPTMTTGTSRGTATGGTATGSHGGICVADNSGTGSTSLVFATNSADSSAACGVKIIASTGSGVSGSVAATLGSFTPAISGAVTNPVGVAYMKEVGFVTDTTAGSTSVITVAAGGVPVGDTIVVYGACDNTGASGAATTIAVADNSTQSGTANTYTLQTPQALADPGAASAGQQGFLVVCNVTRPLLAGDTITITYGNSTAAKAINAQHFTGVNKTTPVLTGTYNHTDNQTTTASSVAATPTAAGQAVCALVAVEGGTADTFTQDTDTLNGSWVTLTRRGSGTTTSGSTLNSVYKIVTASGAQTYNPTLGTARDSCTAILVLDFEPLTFTGTVARTLGSFTSSASGTVTSPPVSGTVAVTLGSFTPTATGIVAITGTVARTLGSFTSTATGVNLFVRYPASIDTTHRKWLDQTGAVWFGKCMSSWGMAQNLSNAEIDSALTSLQSLGFTGVLVAMGGVSENGGWNPNTNKAGDPFWTGSPWQSSLGSGWATIDHLVTKAGELGIVVFMTLFLGSSDSEGQNNELIAAYDASATNPRTAGSNIATRYTAYDNIVWHLEADRNWSAGDATHIDEAVDAFFHGIKDVDGTRRQITYEGAQGVDGYTQFGSGFTYFLPTVQVLYNYSGNSVEVFDDAWNVAGTSSMPVFDCEPPYYLANRYSTGNQTQQIRERTLSVFIRGGCGINWGHEAFWPFNYGGLFDGGETWTTALTDAPTLQAGYAWTLIDTFCKDTAWTRDGGTFLTTGVGSGDTKAASGLSGSAALVYFPTSRTIVVNTTVLSGTGNVRLRWWDPTDGTYSTISASEARSSSRSVTYKSGTHADGAADWVLVVETVNDVTGTVAVTLGSFTSSASGTRSIPNITGTVAVTLASFTPTTSGTSTPPSFTGTVARTLGSFTSSASGTWTPPNETGTVAVTLGAFTSSASGTFTASGASGTVAVTLGAFTSSASGTWTPPNETGTVAVTLAAFTSTASGTSTPPAFTGTVAVTLGAFTSSASGTWTVPNETGTVAATLGSFTSSASGTVAGPGAIVGTVAVTLGSFTSTASGTRSIPNITGTVAVTLAAFTSTATGTTAPPPITGTSARTLAAFTSTASGTSTPPAFTGTVAVTLAAFTSTASGTRTVPNVSGTIAAALGAFIAIATGSHSYTPNGVPGTATGSIDGITIVALLGGIELAAALNAVTVTGELIP